MKNYFEYNSKISSIDVAQAIASPVAPGPFSGFASATIDTSAGVDQLPILKISYLPKNSMVDNCDYLEAIDRVSRRYLSQINLNSEDPHIRFGLIARDGSIHTSGTDIIEVPIQGSKGSLNEVLLFAKHIPINEMIENPVSFIAVWNNSSTSFYDLYKTSTDPFSGNVNIESIDPVKNPKLTYNYLDNKLKTICQTYADQVDSLVFIGAYGTGIKPDRTTEEFALVPYFGKYPVEITYNTYIHRLLFDSVSTIQKLVSSVQKSLGTVEIWAGTSIPPTYLLCDGSQLNIEDYRDLYNAIGDQYNTMADYRGDPQSTPEGYFRLPDLRGRFIVGLNTTPNTDYTRPGNTGGEAHHLLTGAESGTSIHNHPTSSNTTKSSGKHSHNSFADVRFPNGTAGTRDNKAYATGDWSGENVGKGKVIFTSENGEHSHDIDVNIQNSISANASTPHENRPPYYTLAYIMKVKLY